MLASALGGSIHLVLNLADDVPPIWADSGQISQVLVNLILNARDATPQGGTVEIATASRRSGALLTVTDTGSGIDLETQTRIFEPFFTTKGDDGTGIGLSTVYGIVEGSGGSITVDSAPGAGSTFSVVFPAAAPAPPAALNDGAPAAASTSSSLRVLLVEDVRAVRELLVIQLEALGHHVAAADTPARAQEIFEDQGDDFDLVMPGIDGWQLVQRLRERRPDLPVVLMSGYTDGAVDAFDVGGSTAFLQKPFGMDALEQKMQAVVDHRLLTAVA
jgi:CheY-like chemotaxis protein